MSPAMSAAGSSQPARVKDPASHVWGPGSSRCWISADRLSGRVRCPHSYRSVCRRFAITTKARTCASRPIAAMSAARGPGGHRQLQDADGLAPLGHRCQHQPPSRAGEVGRLLVRAYDLHLLGRIACSAGPPSNGQDRRKLPGHPTLLGPPGGGGPVVSGQVTCASRTRARPERSAMRKETMWRPGPTPSSRVTVSTASTGEAASAASRALSEASRSARWLILGA